jgi:hypothetical protein
MPPVVIAVAVGASAFATLGVSLVVAGAIGIGAAVAVKLIGDALVPEFDSGTINPAADQEITTTANQPRKIIYGENAVGGQIIGYAKATINSKEFHIMAIHVAGHPCESISVLEIEGKTPAQLGSALVAEFATGEHTTVNNMALTYIEGWTTEHVGFKQTIAYLKIEIDQDKFPNGVSDIKFLVKGKRIYDPRLDTTAGGIGSQRASDSATWAWSDNSILCAYDWVRYHGYRPIPDRRIPWDFVALAANYCDESVNYQDKNNITQTEKRFTCNGTLKNSLRPGEGLKYLLSSCGAKMYRPNGKIFLKPAMYGGPATITVTSTDFAEQPTYQPHRPERERCNLVRGKHIAPELKYQLTDAPVIQSTSAQASDGTILEHPLNFLMTNSSTITQRLCNLHLQRNRAGFIAEIPMKGIRLDVVPGSVLQYNDPQTGISREFIVENYRLDIRNKHTLITLQEESTALYQDDPSITEPALPANTTLADITLVAAPNNIVFTPKQDSWRVGSLAWSHPVPGSVVKYEVQLSNSPGTVRLPRIYPSLVNEIDLPGIDVGTYGVFVKAINRFGKISSETFDTFEVLSVYQQTGSVWHSGTTVPDNALGSPGDFYRRLGTTEIYNKNAANEWVLDGDLSGNDGDKWLSGLVNPANSLGTDGDMYINTSTNDLFQKIGGSWSLQTNIEGPPGLSAYEVWLAAGNSGTEADFLDSLVGDTPDAPPEKYSWTVFSDSKTTGTIYTTNTPARKYTGTKHNQTLPTPNTTDHALYNWYLSVDVIDLSDSSILTNVLDAAYINVGTIDIAQANWGANVTISATGVPVDLSSSTGTAYFKTLVDGSVKVGAFYEVTGAAASTGVRVNVDGTNSFGAIVKHTGIGVGFACEITSGASVCFKASLNGGVGFEAAATTGHGVVGYASTGGIGVHASADGTSGVGLFAYAYTSAQAAIYAGRNGPGNAIECAGDLSVINGGVIYQGGERLATLGANIFTGIQTASNFTLASSDKKLKTAIKVIPNALQKLSNVPGVTFERIDYENDKQAGIIAQDLQAVLPEGVVEVEGILRVNPMAVVGLLVAAVNELKKEVDELKKAIK